MANFLIVGAGIAGLSAAIALARAGHQVTVHEQASELSEVGAGIQLGPNAMRILMEWGLGEAIRSVTSQPSHLVIRDAKNDHVLTSRALNHEGDAEKKYGAPHVCTKRSDLQAVLLQAALDAGVEIKLGQPFTNQDMSEYDAVFGCDGLHSKVRGALLAGTKHAGEPIHTGHTAYRAMLDMSLLPLELRQQSVQVWLDANLHVVAYPVNSKQLNIVMAQEGEPALATPMSAQLHSLVAAVAANGGFSTWPLYHRPSMWSAKFYAKGNTALLGDAAHPMLPYLAQGAAMAIEDAHALALAVAVQPNIHRALQNYAKARWLRNARVQFQSQLQSYVFHASGLTRLMRDAALKVTGKQLTGMRWLYDYQNVKI